MPKLTDEIAGDILTTAVEGGTGYWAQVDKIKRTEDLTVTSVCFHEMSEDPDSPDVYGDNWNGFYLKEGVTVTLEDVKRAIRKLAGTEPVKYAGPTIRSECRGLIFDPEEVDYDADTADVIVQVAIFGEVVYG